MKQQRFIILGRLPGLNELIAAAKQRYRGKNVAYAKLKADAERSVWLGIRQAKLRRIEGPVFIDFIWMEPNRRRDPDNIAAGGRKIILDALVHANILAGDGWRHVSGWTDRFSVSREAGVLVTLANNEQQEENNGKPTTSGRQ
jgi:Holliday junction resolvase RusA-like endonuclease